MCYQLDSGRGQSKNMVPNNFFSDLRQVQLRQWKAENNEFEQLLIKKFDMKRNDGFCEGHPQAQHWTEGAAVPLNNDTLKLYLLQSLIHAGVHVQPVFILSDSVRIYPCATDLGSLLEYRYVESILYRRFSRTKSSRSSTDDSNMHFHIDIDDQRKSVYE